MKEKRREKKGNRRCERKREKGITLIALVVTIVILVILSTISINAVIGDRGSIKQAQKSKEMYANAVTRDEEETKKLTEEFANSMAEPPEPEIAVGPTGKPLVTGITQAQEEQIIAEDRKGNEVVIPKGFKIAEDSGETVQQGIVIEDVSGSSDQKVQGSQYVWIPVGSFIKDDGSRSKEIILGRYTFDTTTGEETLKQNASQYTQEVTIDSYYIELSEYREGTDKGDGPTMSENGRNNKCNSKRFKRICRKCS